MPWQEADAGTIAKDEQGTFHVKNGDQWVAAPAGSVAKDAAGKYHFNSDSLGPSTTSKEAAPEEPGVLKQIGQAASGTIAAPIARGAGTLVGVAKNVGHMVSGTPYEDPRETGKAWAAPFESEQRPEQPGSEADLKQSRLRQLPSAADIPGVRSAMESPAGQFVGDVVKPAADIVGGVGTAMGVGSVVKAGASALDTGVNALNKPSAAQAATLKSTPQISRMRADGFKIAGGDSYAASNAANPGERVDLHGPTSSSPDTLHTIQRDNQALSTQGMAQDVKLTNTRAVNPKEVEAGLTRAGDVYDQMGQAVGKGRTPTPNLDHDLHTAAPSAADPAATAANQKLVDSYRDHFKNGFDGPNAVQMVKDLRNEAHVGMAGNDVNAQSLGRTKLGIANAIEEEMVRQLPASAQELKTAFPEARMQYAKLKELQAVTEGGQVSPLKVLQLKRSGAPLSGAADAVANAADVAPESMKRAAGTPDILPYAPTRTGLVRDAVNVAKRVAHKLPGNNPATEAYQEAHYGPKGGENATPPPNANPKPDRLSTPPMDLQPPPGNARSGVQTQMPLPPGPAAPPPFELTHPEGTALEPAQRPLVRRNTAGDVMAPAEWDRQALARVRSMTPPERAAAEGPPVPHDKLSTTVKSRRAKPLGRAFDRDRE